MRRRLTGLLLGGLAAGCGGGDSGGPNGGGNNPVMAKAGASGDAQSAALGTVLASPLRVIITQDGNPLSGRTVTWAVSPAGSANPASSTSGADGTAQTLVTLPLIGGAVSITATSAGVTGSPLTFTATATGAGTQVNVAVENTFFTPSDFQLKQGGTVTFTWGAGSGPHTVTPVAPNTIPQSSNPAPPGTHNAPYTFDTTFPATGVFKFFCSVHGAPDTGMHGTITVIP